MAKSLLQRGDVLHSGDYLESNDRRFRLYLEDTGQLLAFAYLPDYGVKRFWGSPVSALAGQGATLEIGQVRIGRRNWDSPAVILRRQDGSIA